MEKKIVFYVVDKDYELRYIYYGYHELFQYCYNAIQEGVVGNSFARTKEGQVDIYHNFVSCMRPKCSYIIQNALGETIPVQLVIKEFIALGYKENRYKTYKRAPVYWEFRKDPVPGTGTGRYRKRLRRRQKYAQELRCNIRDAEYARPKRKEEIHYLSLWAYDQYRSDIFNFYSWKKCKKKKQWM